MPRAERTWRPIASAAAGCKLHADRNECIIDPHARHQERIAWQHREEATTLATVQLAEWTPNLVSAAWPGPPVWLVETAADAEVLQSMLADHIPL